MKKLFLGLLISVVLVGCFKDKDSNRVCGYTDSQTTAPDSEVVKVKAYLDSSHINNAQKHSSGFYYTIHAQGSGTFVTNLCSSVTVTYKGKLTNGNTFDSTTAGSPVVYPLGQFIVGWQKGIPLVNEGGSITLYIPPALGYGSQVIGDGNGQVLIPANSILIFDIQVLDISG